MSPFCPDRAFEDGEFALVARQAMEAGSLERANRSDVLSMCERAKGARVPLALHRDHHCPEHRRPEASPTLGRGDGNGHRASPVVDIHPNLPDAEARLFGDPEMGAGIREAVRATRGARPR